MTRTNSADLKTTLAYHERTKHEPARSARSLGYMDWDNQPDPFRCYAGAETVDLARPEPTDEPRFDALADPAALPLRPLDGGAVGQLLFDALALSAWKAAGEARWSLRCNPSSGNLHPTEAYLLLPALEGLFAAPTLSHYAPRHHRLERRRELTREQWAALSSGLPSSSLLLGLTSIHWRESWKYGERAFRYCQHDVGHAVAAVSYAAAALGWRARLLEGIDDDALAALLGLEGQRGPDAEHPDALLALSPAAAAPAGELVGWSVDPTLIEALRQAPLHGEPNELSPHHHPWPVIDEVAAATHRRGPIDPEGRTAPVSARSDGGRSVTAHAGPLARSSARQIFRSRRSAVEMDSRSTMSAEAFARTLWRLLPGAGPPLETLPWSPAAHLVLFVHRVDDVAPGLYLLLRDPDQERALRASLHNDYVWRRCPAPLSELPLYLLADGSWRDVSRDLSCRQEIASQGAFAAAMLCRYEPRLRQHGAWAYRRLFWEAGAIGQVLYLEAEAAGLRGCGIGCYFDELVHEVLGLGQDDRSYQSLYHFTVGGALDDPRLETLPAYD